MASVLEESLTADSNSDEKWSSQSPSSIFRLARQTGVSSNSSLTRHNQSVRGSLRKSSFDLEVNASKLRFHALRIHGRDNEQKKLMESLENLATKHQLVLISGESGTGKSTLAISITQVINQKFSERKGIVLCGKFDLAHSLPYAAFVQALQSFVGHVLSLKESDIFQSVQSTFRERIGRQEQISLLQTFPDLEELFPRDDHPIKTNNNDKPGQEKSRLHHAFRDLVNSIGEHLVPFVIVLDDLQWVDSASLELLEFLLSDVQQTHKVLIIGCYRSEQVTEAHVLIRKLNDLRVRQESNGAFEITDIPLENLDVKDTARVLADLLSMDSDDCKLLELAEVCRLKTQGNAFFLIAFVTRLFQEKSLEYQLGSFAWEWDIAEIKSREVTENVADFVKHRMTTLPDDALLAVKLAACLGDRFPYKVLKVLYDHFNAASETGLDYKKGVSVLIDEFILQNESGEYARFAHDKVKEAASNLIPREESQSFKKRVGDVLLASFNLGEMDTSVFIVADLCNEGPIPVSPDERLQMARVNLAAAMTASKMTAIEIASHYAERGIQLLPEDKWASQEELSCSLYQIACRMECCIGHYAKLEVLSTEILGRREIPFEKRLPVYYAIIHMLESKKDCLQDAIDLSLEVLCQMGYKFPKNKHVQLVKTIGVLGKTKSLVKSLTPEVVDKLPVMKDPQLNVSMRALDKLSAVCFIARSPLFALVVYRSLDLTLKYGICDSSPAAFASIGLLLGAAVQDYRGAACFADHALRLMKRLPNPEAVYSRVNFLTHFFSLSWSQPINNIVKPILKAYGVGLRIGDVDSAVYSIGTYVIIALIAGRSLEGLAEDCRIYFGQMRELGRERMYVSSNLIWQLILNFRGESDDHLTLTGVAMDEAEFLALVEDPKHRSHLTIFYHVRAMLFAVFGEHGFGAKHAIANSKLFFKLFPGYPGVPCTTYYFGISLFSTARKTKSCKHAAKAGEMIKRTKNYINKGNPNAAHYLLGLEAELLAMQDQFHEAVRKFEAAIAVAAHCGFIHDTAIMNERYGEFLLDTDGHQEKAVFYLDKAFQQYVEWGAQKKADLLRRKYRNLWPSPEEVIAVMAPPSSESCGSSNFSLE